MEEPVPIDKSGKLRGASLHHSVVERTAASAGFQKSNRLRELLQYLCERALEDPGTPIREQDIGVAVFGRAPGYDTSQDTLVRVQVSQLRKKLQQYFESDGTDQPVWIEIPKGSYTPIFRDREVVPVPADTARTAWLRTRVNGLTLLFAVLAVAGWGVSAWLARREAAAIHPSPAVEAGPAVDRLWTQMFGNGRPLCLVPSDVSLVVFQDLIGRQLAINEYRRGQFGRIADELITDPERLADAKLIAGKPSTHATDAQLVGTMQVLSASHGIHTDVVFARDFGTAYLESHNVILLGTRRANPWVELFEGQLNFRSRFQESPQAAFFDNHAPLPGEEATYAGVFGHQGYCRVAFLPNQARTGHILIISGTDMASTQAGGQFVGSDHWVNDLRSRLRLSGDAPFPYFEVLLKVAFPTARATQFEVVAHRTAKS